MHGEMVYSTGMNRYRFLLLLLPLLIAACGAHSPRVLSDSYKSIHIPVVKNQTFEVALEERFTHEMIDAFKRDGRLRVANGSHADLQMDATITDVQRMPLTYSDLDRAVGYDVAIAMTVSVSDRESGALVMGPRPFNARGVFLLSDDPTSGRVLNVGEAMAEQVLSALIEGW